MLENNLYEIVTRVILAVSFGLGAIVFFFLGIKRLNRFFLVDYHGNSNEKLKDNFLGNIYSVMGTVCLIFAFLIFQEELRLLLLAMIPMVICMGVFVLPIAVLGAYWSQFITNKLWGGLLPTVRAHYGCPESPTVDRSKLRQSDIKLSKKNVLMAVAGALIASIGTYILLHWISWNGSVIGGLIFRLVLSIVIGFSVFMIITSATVARKIQQ